MKRVGRNGETARGHDPTRNQVRQPQIAAPPAGSIFRVPTEEPSHDTKATRRHILLNGCQGTHGGSLAAASRSSLEAVRFGAVMYTVRFPAGAEVGTDPGTGFTETSYIFPARLIYRATRALSAPRGDSRGHLAGVRQKLAEVLGIRQGPTTDPVGEPGSRRGRVVRLAESPAKAMGISHALVVTQHAYSGQGRQQVLVPILPHGVITDAADIRVSSPPWLASISSISMTAYGAPFDPASGVVLGVSLLTSVSQNEGDIAEELAAVADTETLEKVDAALTKRFHLPTLKSVNKADELDTGPDVGSSS